MLSSLLLVPVRKRAEVMMPLSLAGEIEWDVKASLFRYGPDISLAALFVDEEKITCGALIHQP